MSECMDDLNSGGSVSGSADEESPVAEIPETILADGVSFSTDTRKTRLNNNVIVFGTPGSGKTRSIVEPNILQANSSFVVTDPKGSLYDELWPGLRAAGYEIKCLNLVRPGESWGYNPFTYMRTDEDLDFLAEAIVGSTGRFEREPFWDDATVLLLKAVIRFCKELHEFADADGEMTMREVLSLLDMCSFPADPASRAASAADQLFEELRTGIYWIDGEPQRRNEGRKDSEACALWRRFQQIAPAKETAACIMMEAHGKLAHLASSGILGILDGKDSIDFRELGRRKTALFVIVSDVDRSLDFLTSIFYSQLFKELCDEADRVRAKLGHRLKVPVRVILDDFANQAQIPSFDSIIAGVRSREIWVTVVCQATAQLEACYGAAAATIVGCCDSAVYLGVNDMGTAKELSARADIPIDEAFSLPLGEAFVFQRGSECKRVPLYDVESHPNYAFFRGKEAQLVSLRQALQRDPPVPPARRRRNRETA